MLQKKVVMAIAMTVSAGAHAAGDADLAAIRAQIEQMKQSYEQRIAALEQKLTQAEAKASTAEQKADKVERAVEAQPIRSAAAAPANGFNPAVSLIFQGQYKSMKEVPERGISGFMSAPHNHAAGTIEENSKRGFSANHTELILSANIDPNWRGQAIVALVDKEVEVEEAWFQSIGLGNGLGLKGGRFRSGIGYLNEQHNHQWDFADAPLMYQAMFGTHGSYIQDGVQFKWLAPTDTFIELGAEVGRGATFPGTNRNKNGGGTGALFAHVGDDISIAHSWRAGLSYLQTHATAREAHMEDINAVEALTKFSGRSSTVLADFVWKWAPDGNPRERNFKFQTEYFRRTENGNLNCADADDANPTTCTGGVDSLYRTRQNGWYAQGVYQLTRHWRTGVRHDRLDSGTRDFGTNAANLDIANFRPKRTAAMVDYSWSEYSRMRLQVARDESMVGLRDNQLTLQYIMSLGAHGAHKF